MVVGGGKNLNKTNVESVQLWVEISILESLVLRVPYIHLNLILSLNTSKNSMWCWVDERGQLCGQLRLELND